jgi:hypothetical protein
MGYLFPLRGERAVVEFGVGVVEDARLPGVTLGNNDARYTLSENGVAARGWRAGFDGIQSRAVHVAAFERRPLAPILFVDARIVIEDRCLAALSAGDRRRDSTYEEQGTHGTANWGEASDWTHPFMVMDTTREHHT